MVKTTIITKISESGLVKCTEIKISNTKHINDPILKLTPYLEFLKSPVKQSKKRYAKIITREANEDEVYEYYKFCKKYKQKQY
jgi:hypothetical protein